MSYEGEAPRVRRTLGGISRAWVGAY